MSNWMSRFIRVINWLVDRKAIGYDVDHSWSQCSGKNISSFQPPEGEDFLLFRALQAPFQLVRTNDASRVSGQTSFRTWNKSNPFIRTQTISPSAGRLKLLRVSLCYDVFHVGSSSMVTSVDCTPAERREDDRHTVRWSKWSLSHCIGV